ncbi:MAG: hypothetical protein K2L27_04115 [Muribaculaceae bacterium]|nr:hypothetical protein [Muribaculaceae bacterium]
MSEAKEKDRILAQIQAFKPINEIEGLTKHLFDLEQAGFITVKYDAEKTPIFIRITTNGKAFLESGGYTRLSRAQTRRNAKGLVLRIVENVAVALISGYAGWALRGYTQSDNPECGEANRLIIDSTLWSSESQLGLNEDSVASRAKSLTESLESSASTLANDSIRILEIETSAKHSAVRDESKAMPSGK